MLDSTVDSVNSALKRARASLQSRQPPTAEHEPAPAPDSPSEQAARGAIRPRLRVGDLDGLVALLTDDIFRLDAADSLEYQGRDVVARLFASIFGSGRRADLVPTRANGQAGVRAYLRASTGIRHGSGLFVLTLTGDRIRAFTRFESSVLHRSGYRDRSEPITSFRPATPSRGPAARGIAWPRPRACLADAGPGGQLGDAFRARRRSGAR